MHAPHREVELTIDELDLLVAALDHWNQNGQTTVLGTTPSVYAAATAEGASRSLSC